ncbi:MAG: hypothetical protein Cons2KO_05020 [Congregibacter sp.]
MSSLVDHTRELRFTHSQEVWVTTDLELHQGQAVTLHAQGQVDMGLPMPASPSLFLWARIGVDGEIFNVSSEAHTFVADRDGELFLAVRSAGINWMDRRGSYAPDFGGVPRYPIDAQVQVFVWAVAPDIALSAMAATGESRWIRAMGNYRSVPQLPEGFEYLWHLGQSTVFEAFADDERVGVRGMPSNDAGIIRKPLDIPLDESTALSFDWLYRQLPAKGPETEARYHDYLSIALEFDNGQDLTWFWSGHLEPGTEFTCPLPGWNQIETHVALQSGEEGLGEWHSHRRPVLRDYESAVGGELPRRIVAVWFINSGVFGDKPGEAVFANVQVHTGSRVIGVFPSADAQ